MLCMLLSQILHLLPLLGTLQRLLLQRGGDAELQPLLLVGLGRRALRGGRVRLLLSQRGCNGLVQGLFFQRCCNCALQPVVVGGGCCGSGSVATRLGFRGLLDTLCSFRSGLCRFVTAKIRMIISPDCLPRIERPHLPPSASSNLSLLFHFSHNRGRCAFMHSNASIHDDSPYTHPSNHRITSCLQKSSDSARNEQIPTFETKLIYRQPLAILGINSFPPAPIRQSGKSCNHVKLVISPLQLFIKYV